MYLTDLLEISVLIFSNNYYNQTDGFD